MKEKYREPEMDIILLLSQCDDIICASTDVELDYGNPDNWTGEDVD